jgi:hypothetical protein
MELAQRARVYYKVLINGTTTAYTSGNDLWFITEARSQSDFEDRCALYSSPSQVAEKIAEFAKIREERAAKFKEMAEAQEKAVKLNIDQIEKEHLANLERIKLPSPAIGMTMHQVSERTFMGRPLRTSKTINATGTYETWYYENRRFMILFFHNGRLAQMSE